MEIFCRIFAYFLSLALVGATPVINNLLPFHPIIKGPGQHDSCLSSNHIFDSCRLRFFNKLDDIKLKAAFKTLANGRDRMDNFNFAEAMDRLSLGIQTFEVKDIFLEMDKDCDGQISFEVVPLGQFVSLLPSKEIRLLVLTGRQS